MFCAVPLVQFCVIAFNGYTVNTDAFLLFVVQIGNLSFFKAFFSSRNNVFIWMLLIVSLVLLLYLLRYPRDRATNTEDIRRNLFKKIDSGEKGANDGKGSYFSLITGKQAEVKL